VPGQARAKGFYARLPGAFVFPFRGNGVLVLIVATLLFTVLGLRSFCFFAIVMQISFYGYLFSFMQNILHATAVGDDEMPELPSMSSFWEDLLLPFLRLLGVGLVSFLPALCVLGYALSTEQPAAAVMMVPAVIFGYLYFPMAFLAVAMLDSIAAVNPLVVVPSILKAPLEYLVTVILLGAVFFLESKGDALVGGVFAGSFMTESMGKLVLILLMRLLWAFVPIYLLTVGTRVLGLLYVSKREELGWMRH
jgi:uncharacterized membrane protein